MKCFLAMFDHHSLGCWKHSSQLGRQSHVINPRINFPSHCCLCIIITWSIDTTLSSLSLDTNYTEDFFLSRLQEVESVDCSSYSSCLGQFECQQCCWHSPTCYSFKHDTSQTWQHKYHTEHIFDVSEIASYLEQCIMYSLNFEGKCQTKFKKFSLALGLRFG